MRCIVRALGTALLDETGIEYTQNTAGTPVRRTRSNSAPDLVHAPSTVTELSANPQSENAPQLHQVAQLLASTWFEQCQPHIIRVLRVENARFAARANEHFQLMQQHAPAPLTIGFSGISTDGVRLVAERGLQPQRCGDVFGFLVSPSSSLATRWAMADRTGLLALAVGEYCVPENRVLPLESYHLAANAQREVRALLVANETAPLLVLADLYAFCPRFIVLFRTM